jgi:hypothetical protein
VSISLLGLDYPKGEGTTIFPNVYNYFQNTRRIIQEERKFGFILALSPPEISTVGLRTARNCCSAVT